MKGYIKIHRKFSKWEWYQKSQMVHLFLHFLILANHKDGKWQGKVIKKGQFITGLQSLKRDTGISAQSLRTCIERLKSTGEITYKSTNRFRVITVVKWQEYQSKSTGKSTGKLTNNQQATNKQLTANKNVKNDKNVKNILTGDKKIASNDIELLSQYVVDLKGNDEPIARYCCAAGDLLTLCDNSLEAAKKMVDKVMAWAAGEGLEWSLELASKKYLEFK